MKPIWQELRDEMFNGKRMRFVRIDDEWYAALTDVLWAVNINSIQNESIDYSDLMMVDINGSREFVVDEVTIYSLIFKADTPEARKLRKWTGSVLRRLRKHVGLKGYEVFKMTEEDTQLAIDDFLDTIFFDEENNRLMMSVTVQGGDVDQVPVDFEPGDL